MPFCDVLTSQQKTNIRANNFYSSAYILINPINIVFAAQVNQTIFATTYAELSFNNVTTGAITNVKDGYTIYISNSSEDAINTVFELRARGNGAAGTVLKINETSFDIQNDQYIVVVKEVVGREKLGRYINKTAYADWDITFRQLLPLVTNLQSAYAGKLSGGSATFIFPAVGFATTKSATISSWLWDADGGSFVNGTVATDAQPDIRYTTAGVYWPRVTVTDNGGRSNWFTMPVWVLSEDMADDFIIKGVDALSITSRTDVGHELSFTGFSQEFAALPRRSVIAVYEEPSYNGTKAAIVDNILFIGRLRRATPKNSVQDTSGQSPDTDFICEGFLGQMNRIRCPSLALTFDTTPTQFGEISYMTQWRITVFILSEFSTFLNLCSLRFDDETEAYLNASDSTEDKSLLASVNSILSARKSALNNARTGEFYAAQSAVFLSASGRNGLDTIHQFTTNDLFQFSDQTDPVPQVGSVELFGGGYKSSNGELQIIRSVAPAVASLEAQGGVKPVNGILLASDASETARKAEMNQFAGNELADANPKDTPQLDILDGFYFICPTNFQWWGLILNANDNNYGITYTSNDRFLLESVTIRYLNDFNTWDVSIAQTKETQGVGAKTLSQVQPGVIDPGLPTIPSIPAYPGFPALDTIFLPTGYNEFNIPSIGQGGGAIVISPLQPSIDNDAATKKGSVVMIADIEELYLTRKFTESDDPPWGSAVFTAESGYEIRDAKFDPHSNGAYVLTTDGNSNTKFYRTDNIFESVPEWDEVEFSDIEYSTIRITAEPGELYIFGIDDRVPPSSVTFLNTNTDVVGELELLPSSLNSPHSGSSNAPGYYSDSGSYNLMEGSAGTNGGVACNVEMSVPARAIIKQIRYYAQSARPGAATNGERTCEVSLDGVNIGGTNAFGAGTWAFPTAPLSGTGTLNIVKGSGLSLSLTGSTLLFHVSIDKKQSDGARAAISQITVWMEDSGKDMPAFRRGTNYGRSKLDWDGLKTCGTEITSPGQPGYDTGAIDTTVLLGADDVVRGTDNYGITFGDKVGTDTTGTHAAAIRAYGKQSNVDTIIATAAIFDTDKTVLSIENASPVDITPDDGVDKGIVVNRNCLDMSRVSDDDISMIADFGGTIKFCYTDDRGATSWIFPTTGISSGANYLRIKQDNTKQVYVADVAVARYSGGGGATGTWHIKTTPLTAMILIEVR